MDVRLFPGSPWQSALGGRRAPPLDGATDCGSVRLDSSRSCTCATIQLNSCRTRCRPILFRTGPNWLDHPLITARESLTFPELLYRRQRRQVSGLALRWPAYHAFKRHKFRGEGICRVEEVARAPSIGCARLSLNSGRQIPFLADHARFASLVNA
jgi:hypothetical protein